MSKKKYILLSIIIIFVFLSVFFWFKKDLFFKKDLKYNKIHIKKQNLKKTVVADGEVVVDYEISLASEIPGIVSKVYVEEGDFVKKGQILMKLKDTDYRDQINSAYLNEKINETSLEKIKNPNQNLYIDQKIIKDNNEIIDANITKTKKQINSQINSIKIYLSQLLRMEIDDYFDHTDRTKNIYDPTFVYRLKSRIETSSLEKERVELGEKYEKYKNSDQNIDDTIKISKDFEKMLYDLYKNSKDLLGYSEKELEEKEKHLSGLKNELSAKRIYLVELETALDNLMQERSNNDSNFKKTTNTVHPADVKLAEENIKKAKIQINSIYTQLQKTYIKAPKNGIIVGVYKKQGEYTAPAIPLVKINSEKKYIEVDIPEVDIVKIKKGMNVDIKIDALKNRVFQGKVDFIYPEKKEIFGIVYYKTKILFIGEEWKKENILPGMSVEVDIVYNRKKNVFAIKRNITKKDDKGYFVKIFNQKNEPIKKYFKTGFVGDDFVEVLSGIDEKTEILKEINKK